MFERRRHLATGGSSATTSAQPAAGPAPKLRSAVLRAASSDLDEFKPLLKLKEKVERRGKEARRKVTAPGSPAGSNSKKLVTEVKVLSAVQPQRNSEVTAIQAIKPRPSLAVSSKPYQATEKKERRGRGARKSIDSSGSFNSSMLGAQSFCSDD